MLIIEMDGGVVSSITTDSILLRHLLSTEVVVVLDYDTDGGEEEDLIQVHEKDETKGMDAFCGRWDCNMTALDVDKLKAAIAEKDRLLGLNENV